MQNPDEDEMDAQQELLTKHRRTLAVYIRQLAQHSSSHVPPSIVHGIFEAGARIRQIKSTLASQGVETQDETNDMYCQHEDFQSLLSVIYPSYLHTKRSNVPSSKETSQTTADILIDEEDVISNDPIKITAVILNEVTKPLNDGTPGSALYQIPFQLSRIPSWEWSQVFVSAWDHPSKFSTMHRPGIAQVIGDRIILDGTTIEEVERYHLETLKLAVAQANKHLAENEKAKQQQTEIEAQQQKQHEDDVRNSVNRLKFD